MIDDANLVVLQKMLDTATLRHKAIAQNMANVETRGYRRRVVRFQDRLAEAIAAGDPRRLETLRPEMAVSQGGVDPRTDNNVTMEQEITSLMHNALLYRTCTQLLSSRIAGYRAAITGHSAR